MNFQIQTSVFKRNIICTLLPEYFKEGLKYYFYLLKDDSVLQTSGEWSGNRKFEFRNLDEGVYVIQGYILDGDEKIYKRSKPNRVAGIDEENRYSDFINSDSDDFVHPSPGVFYYDFPYQSFGLITSRSVDLTSRVSVLKSGIDLEDIQTFTNSGLGNAILFSRKTEELEGEKYVFSGISRTSKKLINGISDIVDISELREIKDNIGNFSLLTIKNGCIDISSDYFGVSKLFYYQSNNYLIVANSYHLLLVLLKNADIDFSFNKDKVIANFDCLNIQPLYQNFTTHMDVFGCRMLPIDKAIQIFNGEFKLLDSEISLDMRDESSLYQYDKLLEAAKNDIIDNIRVAYDSPHYDHLIFDVSGGMDSRLVYSALTNLELDKNRIRIASYLTPGQDRELPVALGINNIYKFPFDDLPTSVEYLNENANLINSYFLGQYYNFNGIDARRTMSRVLRLSGMYGEIVCRPYYSRGLFDSELDGLPIDDFIDQFLERYQNYHSLMLDDSSGSFLKLFTESLKEIPGDDGLEKLDLFYLYYRCGMHCSDIWRSYISCPEWGPLQSKNLFKLKISTFSKFKGIKLQLDLMQSLNPVLASLPFESDQDNEDKKTLKDDIKYDSTIFKSIDIPLDTDDTGYRSAGLRKREGADVLNVKNLVFSYSFDHAFSMLRSLVKGHPNIFDSGLGLALFNFLSDHSKSNDIENAEYTRIFNKIYSLYLQSYAFLPH